MAARHEKRSNKKKTIDPCVANDYHIERRRRSGKRHRISGDTAGSWVHCQRFRYNRVGEATVERLQTEIQHRTTTIHSDCWADEKTDGGGLLTQGLSTSSTPSPSDVVGITDANEVAGAGVATAAGYNRVGGNQGGLMARRTSGGGVPPGPNTQSASGGAGSLTVAVRQRVQVDMRPKRDRGVGSPGVPFIQEVDTAGT